MTLRAGVCALVLACGMTAAQAQEASQTSAEDVRAELGEAMDALGSYTADRRDAALDQASEALDRVDAEIERREQALREGWSGMSDSARETARARLNDLRDARTELAERYGALQSASDSAWKELQGGFRDAWSAFSEAWSAADEADPTEATETGN